MKKILLLAFWLPLSICTLFGQNRTFQRTLLFDVGKSVMRPSEEFALHEAIDTIRLEPMTDYSIALIGNTDNTGSTAFNQTLSEQRCASVKQFLMEKGIPLERFKTQGLGEQLPVAENNSDKGKQLNRRVELRIIWQQKNIAQVATPPTDKQPVIVPVQAAPIAEIQNIEQFYQQLSASNTPQTFTITASTSENRTIETEKSTILQFPPLAFDLSEGTPIKITVKEFYRMEDIIAQGLSTQTNDGRLLVSGGMLSVEAKTLAGKIVLPIKPYTIAMPRQAPATMSIYEATIPEDNTTRMQVFTGNTRQNVLWEQYKGVGSGQIFYDRLNILKEKRRTLQALLQRLTDTTGCYKMLVFRKYTRHYEWKDGKKVSIKDSITVYSDRRPKGGYRLIGVNESDESIAPLCLDIAEWVDSARMGTAAEWQKKHRRIQQTGRANIYRIFNARILVKTGSWLLGNQKEQYVWSYDVLITNISKKIKELDAQEATNQKLWAEYQRKRAALTNQGDSTNVVDMTGKYIFQTQEMGWINCDYFWKTDPKLLVNVETNIVVKDNMQAVLVFKRRKAVMNINGQSNLAEFKNIARDEEAVIIAFSTKNGKPMVAMQDIITASESFNLEFQAMTPEVLREKLKMLN